MDSQLVLIPTITVHPHQINFYKQIVWSPKRPSRSQYKVEYDKEFRNHEHLLKSKRSPEGKVSQIAKRKITKAIDYMLLFASDKKVTAVKTGRKFTFKIAFITLTLPSQQIHTDNEIKRKCLNSFLIELQKYEKVENFIWRAEQQENGNIHFHIIIDKFVHWNDIRNRWNRIINKLGYVDRYRESMKLFYKDGFKVREELKKTWPEEKQKKAYAANLKTDYNNPNSTDIHSIKKIHNLTNYFVKYLTKNVEKQEKPDSGEIEKKKQTGRIWGCSRKLQKIKGASIVVDNEIEQELRQIISQSKCKVYHSEYFSIFYIDFPELSCTPYQNIFKQFSNYLIEEFDYHHNSELAV